MMVEVRASSKQNEMLHLGIAWQEATGRKETAAAAQIRFDFIGLLGKISGL